MRSASTADEPLRAGAPSRCACPTPVQARDPGSTRPVNRPSGRGEWAVGSDGSTALRQRSTVRRPPHRGLLHRGVGHSRAITLALPCGSVHCSTTFCFTLELTTVAFTLGVKVTVPKRSSSRCRTGDAPSGAACPKSALDVSSDKRSRPFGRLLDVRRALVVTTQARGAALYAGKSATGATGFEPAVHPHRGQAEVVPEWQTAYGDSDTTGGMASSDGVAGSDSPRSWRGVLDAYAEPRLGRSVLDLATSVLPYLALLLAMTFALRVSVMLSLVLVLPTSAFLIRTFIVFHDCTHGSFMRSRRARTGVPSGGVATSQVTSMVETVRDHRRAEPLRLPSELDQLDRIRPGRRIPHREAESHDWSMLERRA
jgi:hypothetical protein